MTALSPVEFCKSLDRIKSLASIILLYGSNDELKSDILKYIRKYLEVSIDDPFRLTRLESDDLDSDPGRLADELGAISMFGGSRLIEAQAAVRQVPHLIRQAQAVPRGDCHLVIISGDLGDADWLPQIIQQSEVACVGCAEERAGDFHSFVLSEFTRLDLKCDAAAAETLILLVGDDRSAVRGEIEKLSALLGPGGDVRVEDVRDVVADASSMLAEEIALAAFAGDCVSISRLMDRLKSTGSDPVQALGAALRHALSLHRSKARQWGSRTAPGEPNWTASEVRGLVKSLAAAVGQVRADSANADLLAERSLVALAQTARVRKR